MIRRWSCVKNLNQALVNFAQFYKHKRLKIFRDSVNYKKFYTLRTRFKRRQIMRLKHTRNWLIYLNIIKYWTDEYRISKKYVRFQYKNRFFVFNSIIINGNQTIRHQGRVFMPQDQWVSASNTNRFMRLTSFKYFSYLSYSYRGINHVHAFYPTLKIVPNEATAVAVSIYDLNTFVSNSVCNIDENIEFDFDLVENFLFLVTLTQCYEIYQILKLLWYLKLSSSK